MPKKAINSFNAGELSPYLYARSDLDKYQSGCLTMENFTPLPYGGATRRPAIEYIGDSKQDDKIRLISFTPSTSNSFLLELGEEYIRFYKDGAQILVSAVPYEIGSPYAAADLGEIKFSQSADVMWLAHPDYPLQRLSHLGDSDWTLEPEAFDYPPLMEENDTDITMSPDSATGVVTLTASRDFFDAGHVGGYFKFDAIRNVANQNLNGNFDVDSISSEIYVSGSNWELTTTGSWLGRLIIQKSDDGGVSWEDYITLIDTRASNASAGQRNVTASSEEPEPFGRRLRLNYIDGPGTSNCSYDLKLDNTMWPTLVKITGYTSATEVVGEVIGEFQDVPADYATWATSTSYSEGNKVSVDAGIDYVSGADVTLTGMTGAGAADLDEIVGADFGDDQFWFVTEGVGNQYIYKVDSGLTNVDARYDLSSDFSEIKDIAFFSNHVYVSGIDTFSRIKKYSLTGTLVSTELSISSASKIEGLSYHNGYFYLGIDVGALSQTAKYTTGFTYTGTVSFSGVAGNQDDITGVDDRIYVANNTDNSIDIFNESLDSLGSVSISGVTTDPQGLAYDGTNLWVVKGAGVAYKYELVKKNRYYECVADHSSGTFSTDYGNGYWADRTPEMETWSEGAFSDYRGHSQAIALFENRLCYAGTASEPNTIWMSVIDDFSNFRIGELDADGLKLTMNSGKIDEIRWMVPQERLVIGTAGSEWSLGASDERKAISPTGFDLKRKTSYGSNDVQAILVNSAVVFLMRQSRKVREWTPNYNIQDYVAPDLSILAEHITDGGITQWDYQQQPDNVLWCIRADGTLIGFTYERDQNVTGWHRHVNDEFLFESVAVIPRDDEEDEVWVSVNMGGTRMIGRMNDREWGTDYLTEWQGSDLYVTDTSPGATLGGLTHLEGKEVVVVADGSVLDNITPSTITVSGAGVSAMNGDYILHDIVNDRPRWKFTTTPYPGYITWTGSQWQISMFTNNYNNAGTNDLPPKTGWVVGTAIGPAPTLSYVIDDEFTVADGVYLGTNSYTTVTAGLPFTSTLAPLYLNIENQYGTSKGGKVSNRKAHLHFKDTFSAKCGQTVASVEDVKFDSDDTALYDEVAPTWFDNASDWLLTTYVVQEDPMPCTILAMITDVEVD